ncbi:hypothetical protein Pfra02_43480 [Pseudomonas fragi]|nr:hypothetical protein Pfra02_43480 [Pseudomonas fragi]
MNEIFTFHLREFVLAFYAPITATRLWVEAFKSEAVAFYVIKARHQWKTTDDRATFAHRA